MRNVYKSIYTSINNERNKTNYHLNYLPGNLQIKRLNEGEMKKDANIIE